MIRYSSNILAMFCLLLASHWANAITVERFEEIRAEVEQENGPKLTQQQDSVALPENQAQSAEVKRINGLIENMKNALDGRDIELIDDLLPLIKKRLTEPDNSNSEGKATECATKDSNCSTELQNEAARVEGMAEGLTAAAEEGDVSEFKRILASLDSDAAKTLPKDIGWGKGTRNEAALEACVKKLLTEEVKSNKKPDPPKMTLSQALKECSSIKVEADSDFFLGLYGGVEGTTINDIQDEATLRVGVNVYNQLARFQPRPNRDQKGSNEADKSNRFIERINRCKDSLDCGFGFGLHGWFNLLLTSSGENSAQVDDSIETEMDEAMTPTVPDPMNPNPMDPDAMSPDTIMISEAEVEQAVEAELGLYVPVYRKRLDRFGSLLIGPMAQTSISRIDNVDRFVRRHYGGVRFAYSPETWLDLTYGKTEGLDGRRAELRMQVPLRNISADSRLFLGTIINVGVKDSGDEPDSFRLYLTWNTGTSNLFKSK